MTHTSDDFLTAERVRDVYARCFRPESEYHPTRATRTQVEAWLFRHTFSVPQLTRAREDIIKMLLCLPAGFRSDVGEGGSVVMAVARADKVLWTGDMSDVEKLVALGMAVGLVSFVVPREKWHLLPKEPGAPKDEPGPPYVRVEITKFGVSVN